MPQNTKSRKRLKLAEPAHRSVDADAGGFSAVAAHKERVRALLDIGLTSEELAQACHVAVSTIRNWREGTVAPRLEAVRVIDDLRTTVVILEEAGLDGLSAAQWLRSRNRDGLELGRPLDLVRAEPLSVLAAAETLAVRGRHDPAHTAAEPREAEPLEC